MTGARHTIATPTTAPGAIGVVSIVADDMDALLSAEVPDRAVRGFLMMNLAGGPAGLSWRPNLALLERSMDEITGFPELGHGIAWHGPALFLHGMDSQYAVPDHHAKVHRLFPHARFHAVPGAGHWVQSEQPALFVEALTRFIAAHRPTGHNVWAI